MAEQNPVKLYENHYKPPPAEKLPILVKTRPTPISRVREVQIDLE